MLNFLKKFKCEICSQKFSQKEELMQHEQIIHHKDSPYDCKECNQFFSSMEDMRSHLMRFHSYSKK